MIKAIIFDWDGTLFDVFDFLVETYTEVFEKIGTKPWTKKDYQTRFKCDWRGVLKEMGLEKHINHLIDVWSTNKKDKEDQLQLHPNVLETIQKLAQTYQLAIVSSAPKHILDMETERLGVTKYMKTIISQDDVEKPKPCPQPLEKACGTLGVKPNECVYIGDMIEDIQAAKACGMKSIAVTWGIHSKETLTAQHPDEIIDDFKNLTDYIQ